MKPNFALDFRDDSLALLHRTARGWLLVGEVPLDTADLAEALGYLRASALGLSPQGFTTKLILPNSQILYTEIEASAPDATSRRARVRAGLDGLTPYAVDDLSFDVWGQGATVQVAVIARETMAEAEAFAIQHRFNPVSLVGLPPAGKFGGEPFFGPAEGAAAFLPKGEAVSRDQDPVNVVGRARMEDAEPAASTEAAAQTEPASPFETPKPADAKDQPAPATAPEAERAAIVGNPAQKDADPAPVTKAGAAATGPLDEKAKAPPLSTPVTDMGAPDAEARPTSAAKAPADATATRTAGSAAPKAPAASAAADDVVPDVPPSLAFASRRREEAAARREPPPMASAQKPASAPSARGSATAAPPVVAAPVTMLRSTASTDPAIAARANNVTPLPVAPKPAPPKALPVKPPNSKANGLVAALARSRPTLVTTDTLPVDKAVRRADARPASLQPVPSGALGKPVAKPAAPTGLGARKPRPVTRGRPRFLGLILTAVLLIFLTLVAVWSSYYLSRDDGAVPEPIQTAALPDQDAAPPPTAPAPLEVTAGDRVTLPEPQAIARPPEAVAEAVADAVPDLAAEPEITADVAPPVAEPVAETPPPAPPPAGLPTEEAARVAAPGTTVQDEIFLSTSETAPPAFDAVALPAPIAAPDAAPGAQMPPPPFGTVYTFDQNGRIEATETGVITPEGVWLIAARPPLIPPERPAPATPAPVAAAPAPAATDAPAPAALAAVPEAPAPGGFVPDPALADSRPRTRPANLTPPAADPQQAEDDASLKPVTDPRFAATRPRPRAASVAALAPSAGAAQASLVTLASASGTVVQISPRPAPRPQDISGAVQAAVAAASIAISKPPQDSRAASAAPALTPEEEEEPEIVAAAAPRIPTRANVAKQATFVNAINLSKLNLIGIYGTSSSRYALVRTSGGRYDKVKVGDRLDGGRVAAITGSELRYQKSGKIVTLAMPRS